MKRHTLLFACLSAGFCLVLLLSAQPSFGQTVKTIELNFDEKDFEYHYDDNGLLMISSNHLSSTFGSDTSSYALPLVSIFMLIKSNEDYLDITYNTMNQIVLKNIRLAKNPSKIHTSMQREIAMYSSHSINPSKHNAIEYIRTRQYGDYRLLNFLVRPYFYDESSKELSFINKIEAEVMLSVGEGVPRRRNAPQRDLMRDIVRGMIVNPNDIDKSYNSKQTKSKLYSNLEQDSCDYVIITSDSLANSFQPLADWKTQKGVRTEVVTIEHIYNSYSASSNQLKIKLFLKDYYDNRGLQYALLGGDDTVVPVQLCKGHVFPLDLISHYIPADLFYACFGGQFDWNYDGNGDIGEYADSISYDPNIFVSRLPVRKSSEISSFVSRLLAYEKNPPKENWKNSMLMCSTKLESLYYENSDSICETFFQDKILYENFISPYWNGSLTHIYESNSSTLNADVLQSELEKGYLFVNVDSHGMPDYWNMPNNMNYNREYAAGLNSPGPTIITTSSCHTNAFDEGLWYLAYDPCLSESFIRNPNSGVLAYFGCSREGIGTRGIESLGKSDRCIADFYEILFSDSLSEKNFGRVVAAAKMRLPEEHSFLFSYNEDTHWLQLGMNPIGDPEMPIFTGRPKDFEKVKFLWSANGLTIKPGINDTRVCLMSQPDKGISYYDVKYPENQASFYNIPDSFSVCITKQGYIPYVINMSRNDMAEYIQNETITQDRIYSGISIEIGSDVTEEVPHGPVTISNGNVIIDGTQGVVIKNDFEVEQGATLIINGF